MPKPIGVCWDTPENPCDCGIQGCGRAKPQPCEWFARCPRPATGTTPHPVLGQVPTCDKCHAFATPKETAHHA